MSGLAYTLTDSATMLRRNLKHQLRYPSLTLMLAGFPILFLLLFVYVFGGQLGAGLGVHGNPHGDRGAYLTYVVPGILTVTVASAALGTAISVAMDMTEGIIDRFRTMAIARAAVLTGHVIGSLLQTVAVLALVIGVALAIGFRPTANPLEWLAAIGILVLFAFALIWLSAALGLAAKSVETASNTPMFLTLLPFLSSGFVPIATLPPDCANSPNTSPSPQSPRPSADCSPTPQSAPMPSAQSPGALASHWSATSGPYGSTTVDAQPTRSDSRGRALAKPGAIRCCEPDAEHTCAG